MTKEHIINQDKIVIVAHPDDEILGCATLIRRSVLARKRVIIIIVTSGANVGENNIAQIRRQESENALKSIGICESQIVWLNYPDQNTYKHFDEIYLQLQDKIKQNGMEQCILITHAFEGGHPDHDILAVISFRMLQKGLIPEVYCFPLYSKINGVRRYQYCDLDKPIILYHTSLESELKQKAISFYCSQREITKHFQVNSEKYFLMPRDMIFTYNNREIFYNDSKIVKIKYTDIVNVLEKSM